MMRGQHHDVGAHRRQKRPPDCFAVSLADEPPPRLIKYSAISKTFWLIGASLALSTNGVPLFAASVARFPSLTTRHLNGCLRNASNSLRWPGGTLFARMRTGTIFSIS